MAFHEDQDWFVSLDRRAMQWLWRNPQRAQGPAGWGDFLLQMLYLSLRNAYTHRLPFSANALTFITLLGLVPALAISFSLAKGMGFAAALKKLVVDNEFLSGQKEVITAILGYVENTQVGTLGAVGLGILVVTLIIALSNVEEVLNRIWSVHEQRSWLRKFTDYLAVLIIFPLLIISAAAFWSDFINNQMVQWVLGLEVVGTVAERGLNLGPFLLLGAGFSFLYIFLPNRAMPLWSNLLAGFVAAALWWGVHNLYIHFQVGVAKYNAIYGGFASLPLFMVWVQVSWMVVLFGAVLARAHYFCLAGCPPRELEKTYTPAQREALGLAVMQRVGWAFHQGAKPPSTATLAQDLEAPFGEVRQVVDSLQDQGLLTPVGNGGKVQPARPLAKIKASQIRAAVRGPDHAVCATGGDQVEKLLSQAVGAGQAVLAQITLQDLVAPSQDAGPSGERKKQKNL